MSEVTTLKQLMLDAARYRWVRENIGRFSGTESPEEMDAYVDEKLDSE